jgi:hypothetical protein
VENRLRFVRNHGFGSLKHLPEGSEACAKLFFFM